MVKAKATKDGVRINLEGTSIEIFCETGIAVQGLKDALIKKTDFPKAMIIHVLSSAILCDSPEEFGAMLADKSIYEAINSICEESE